MKTLSNRVLMTIFLVACAMTIVGGIYLFHFMPKTFITEASRNEAMSHFRGVAELTYGPPVGMEIIDWQPREHELRIRFDEGYLKRPDVSCAEFAQTILRLFQADKDLKVYIVHAGQPEGGGLCTDIDPIDYEWAKSLVARYTSITGPAQQSLVTIIRKVFPAALVLGLVVIWLVYLATRSPEENRIKEWGTTNPQLICPHCQTKGMVRTKFVKLKKGVSGTKLTGAVLTGGLSLLATGLSRREMNTKAHCGNCDSTWVF